MTHELPETQVRIGELALARGVAPARLTTVGLGSCIGAAVIDEVSGTAALAHVFLPEPPASGAKPGAGSGTYATLAIPELVRQVRAGAGGRTGTLVAVLVGGARMFAAGRAGGDVGERNIEAVRTALAQLGIEVVAEETGGTHGRTMRVESGPHARVSVRQVGGHEQDVWESTRRRAAAASRIAA